MGDEMVWMKVTHREDMRPYLLQFLGTFDRRQFEVIGREVRYGSHELDDSTEQCVMRAFAHSNQESLNTLPYVVNDAEKTRVTFRNPRTLDFQSVVGAIGYYFPRVRTVVASLDQVRLNHYTDMVHRRGYLSNSTWLRPDTGSFWMCRE